MAFFVNFTVECDECKSRITLRASSKRDMNRRLINPSERWESKLKKCDRWFAHDESHICPICPKPFQQNDNGEMIV